MSKQSRLGAIYTSNSLLRVAATASSSTALIGYYIAQLAGAGEGFDSELIGRLNATFNGFALLAAIPGGVLIDRNSPRLVLVIGALLGAIATQLFGISNGNVTFFYASRALEGIGSSLALPAILAYLTDITEKEPETRGRVMSYFEVTLFGGIAIGTLIAGFLWEQVGTTSFGMMAIIYVIAAVVFWFGARGATTQTTVRSSSSLASLREAFSDDALRRLAIPWLIFNTIVGMLLAHATFQLTFQTNGAVDGQWLVSRFSPTELSVITFFFAIFYSLGMLIFGRLVGRINRLTIMRNSFLGLILLAILTVGVNSSADWSTLVRGILIVGVVIGIVFQGGFPPAALAYLADAAGSSKGRGTSMGIYTFLLSLGAVAGAILGGYLAKTWAFNGLLFGTLILAFFGWLALRFVPELKRSDESTF